MEATLVTMYSPDPGDAQAAFADGMRQSDAMQAAGISDPMGGAVTWQAETTQQPFDYEEPGEPPEPNEGPGYGGVT